MWQFQKEIEISWCDKQIVHNLVSLVLYLLLVKSYMYHLLVKHVPPTYLLFSFFRLIFLVDFFVEGENTSLLFVFR